MTQPLVFGVFTATDSTTLPRSYQSIIWTAEEVFTLRLPNGKENRYLLKLSKQFLALF
jgi:hypothetical protein